MRKNHHVNREEELFADGLHQDRERGGRHGIEAVAGYSTGCV